MVSTGSRVTQVMKDEEGHSCDELCMGAHGGWLNCRSQGWRSYQVPGKTQGTHVKGDMGASW
jgi:hypothetical protein